jgi:hypothetical protein
MQARHAGTDSTVAFNSLHKSFVLDKYEHLVVGTVKGHADSAVTTSVDHSDAGAKFGCTDVPYAEPYWYYGSPQPYYGASHAVSLPRSSPSFISFVATLKHLIDPFLSCRRCSDGTSAAG